VPKYIYCGVALRKMPVSAAWASGVIFRARICTSNEVYILHWTTHAILRAKLELPVAFLVRPRRIQRSNPSLQSLPTSHVITRAAATAAGKGTTDQWVHATAAVARTALMSTTTVKPL